MPIAPRAAGCALTAAVVLAGLGCSNGAGSAPPEGMGAPSATAAGGSATPPRSDAARTGRLKGLVTFTGQPPVMTVPAQRREHEVCNRRDLPSNAVLVRDGKLEDVLVRIEAGGVRGSFSRPERPAVLRQVDCVYEPRIQGAMSGQELEIESLDGPVHHPHVYRDKQSFWGSADPKQTTRKRGPVGDPGILTITCDAHEWMRAFVVVTDHPFFAVTDARGTFALADVPAGEYVVEAWHSRYGWKRQHGVRVRPGEATEVHFAYSGEERPPWQNDDERVGP